MQYLLRTRSGATEAVIDDNCGISKFYAIAGALSEDLHVKFINQVDDAENLDWDFTYNNLMLTLHYNIFNGVSITPGSENDLNTENKAVLDIAGFLMRRVF
jgi:hypothetical protein